MRTMPRLHIDTQDAQIGIKTTNAQLQIENRSPKMKFSAPVPTMQAERKQPAFKVDWQRVRNESGLQDPVTNSKQIASEAQNKALEAAGQAVQDGNYLAKTELGGNRVTAIEANKNFDPMPEINLGTIPQSLPDVQWEKGSIHISWSKTQMQVEWDDEYMPTFSVEPHSVEIFLRNQPYIRITVVEEPIVGVDQQV